MDSLDLFYDHYKDTFTYLKGYLNRRDNYTITLFILVVVISFQISEPQESTNLAEVYIKNKFNGITVDFKYINTVLLYFLLWVVILYYQINLLIEKMYNYVHEIEIKLSSDMIYFITREGKSYLKHYPWLSYIVHRIYTILFPLLIIAIAGFKLYHEYKENYDLLYIDSVASVFIIISSLLYLSNRHLKEEYFNKNCFPDLKWHQRFIGYFRIIKYKPVNN